MTAGNLFFLVFALLSLVGALGTVLARNPIRSAVGLLVTIMGIAGLYLMLRAQFLAAIQLIVYAGAVVVLFVFVIMLLGPDGRARRSRHGAPSTSRWVAAGLLGVGSAVALGLMVLTSPPLMFPPAPAEHGSAATLGRMLFTRALAPFELATLLLIVAVVGAISMARGKPRVRSVRLGEGETRRLFVGPVHPRDAIYPLDTKSKEPSPPALEESAT
mgnify:CR=1 FL=1